MSPAAAARNAAILAAQELKSEQWARESRSVYDALKASRAATNCPYCGAFVVPGMACKRCH